MASSEKITFTGSQGDALAARLELPDGTPRAFALFAHCFTCSKDIFAASRIAASLCEQGIAVLRFDFTGLGHSDGEFANTNFSSNVQDLLLAADYLRQSHVAPSIIVGHSLGGAAVLAAAGEVPEARAVATIGAPADPAHVSHNFGAHIEEIEEKGEAEVSLAGRTFRIQKQFLDDIAAQKLEAAIGGLRKALIVFHAPQDQTVSIDNAGQIFLAAKHPKSFVSLDDADHLLTAKRDAIYVGRVLAAWASRYLDGDAADAAQDLAKAAPAPAAGEVVVAETGTGRFTNVVRVESHVMAADEPPTVGGDNLGPTPYGYLTAALGACTSMTVRMYANRKKLPLDKVTVRLRHDKIHAEDCEHCETTEGKVDAIDMDVQLDGDLDEAQRARLLEIAHKCPVHRTLKSEVAIDARLRG